MHLTMRNISAAAKAPQNKPVISTEAEEGQRAEP